MHSSPAELAPRRSILGSALAFEGGLVLVAVALGWLLGQPPLERFHWTPHGFASGLWATLPMLAALVLLQRVSWSPLARFCEWIEHHVVPLFADVGYVGLALISVLAGISEEMLFRGVIQDAAERYTGSWTIGLAIASVLFGLAHAMTRTYAVLAGLIGAYLGVLYAATGNLFAPMVAHAVYDFVALLYLLRRYHSHVSVAPNE